MKLLLGAILIIAVVVIGMKVGGMDVPILDYPINGIGNPRIGPNVEIQAPGYDVQIP